VRLAPPLIITEHQIDTFVTALPGILDLAAEGAQ
jgi:acetylornithine aminotransferase